MSKLVSGRDFGAVIAGAGVKNDPNPESYLPQASNAVVVMPDLTPQAMLGFHPGQQSANQHASASGGVQNPPERIIQYIESNDSDGQVMG